MYPIESVALVLSFIPFLKEKLFATFKEMPMDQYDKKLRME